MDVWSPHLFLRLFWVCAPPAKLSGMQSKPSRPTSTRQATYTPRQPTDGIWPKCWRGARWQEPWSGLPGCSDQVVSCQLTDDRILTIVRFAHQLTTDNSRPTTG